MEYSPHIWGRMTRHLPDNMGHCSDEQHGHASPQGLIADGVLSREKNNICIMIQMMVKFLQLSIYICKQNRMFILSLEILRYIFEYCSVFILINLSVDCYIHGYTPIPRNTS